MAVKKNEALNPTTEPKNTYGVFRNLGTIIKKILRGTSPLSPTTPQTLYTIAFDNGGVGFLQRPWMRTVRKCEPQVRSLRTNKTDAEEIKPPHTPFVKDLYRDYFL